jgi:hypothetical protein
MTLQQTTAKEARTKHQKEYRNHFPMHTKEKTHHGSTSAASHNQQANFSYLRTRKATFCTDFRLLLWLFFPNNFNKERTNGNNMQKAT